MPHQGCLERGRNTCGFSRAGVTQHEHRPVGVLLGECITVGVEGQQWGAAAGGFVPLESAHPFENRQTYRAISGECL